MVTDTYSKMMSDVTIRSLLKDPEDFSILIREQRRQQEASDREKELSMYRSGSAPPTVEGSLNAMGGVFETSVQLGFGRNGGSFMNEEQLLADPAYVNYYYSNVNLNPRLPPPLLSKEDWRFTQRLSGGGSKVGGIDDRRKVSRGDDEGAKGDRSLFSLQPGFNRKEENSLVGRKSEGEWGGDGLIGLSGSGLRGKQRSVAELIQDDMIYATSLSRQPSHPASRNAFNDITESSEISHLHGLITGDGMHSGNQRVIVNQSPDASDAHTYASVFGASLSRSITNDSQHLAIARASSPSLPPIGGGRSSSIGKGVSVGQNSLNAASSKFDESVDLESAFSEMTLSTTDVIDEENLSHSPKEDRFHDSHNLFNQPVRNNTKLHGYSAPVSFQLHSSSQSTKGSNLKISEINRFGLDPEGSGVLVDEQLKLHKYSKLPLGCNSYPRAPCTPSDIGRGNSPSWYRNMNDLKSSFQNDGLSGYAVDPLSPPMMASQHGPDSLPPMFDAAAASTMGVNGMDSRLLKGDFSLGPNFLTAATELQNIGRVGNQSTGNAHQISLMDPLYLQYLRSCELRAAQVGLLNDPSIKKDFVSNSVTDIRELKKAYLGTMLSPQKQHFSPPYHDSSPRLHHNLSGNQGFGLGMSYIGSPVNGHFVPNSTNGRGSPVSWSEQNFDLLGMRNLVGGFMGAWNSDTVGSLNENFASSLLDEFKSNKTKCFELAEIGGHIVEFSADQYGSRFIQQKLETATTDEKNMVFDEIMPHGLTLMTDVFGNYVIQKFFEHGTAPQIRELADQLTGHVLNLSLQMYGCRVIQKAIEVVDIDQKTKLVKELDGHILCCVRDQNGNHVIQKCIECVPEGAIDFIITPFYDQVVTMSTHPYGCRVIQRVLEHCHDQKTQSIMMDEILQSVCMLAQDQYGNYVVQHVLEHGKSNERSAIIKELTGQIVQMSQQKFASNVIEKCLTFGTLEERKVLVNEMLGTTDENEPLQVMMKDQFGNYVVQKVLETCDDQQLEMILNRIKVHLNALKKYTYGKHIVARVEKLVAAGERRISVLALNPAA